MEKKIISLLLFSIFCNVFTFGQNQQQEQKSVVEMAEEQAERLQKLLNLEAHQVFYVDSILQHDMEMMKQELEKMKASGTQDFKSYQTVQEKWIDKIEEEYKKIFTEQQWTKYLKHSGKNQRDKKKKKR